MMLRAAAAATAAVALHAVAAPPVAFVADVAGSATIAGDGRLTFLAELEAGTRLFLGTGARAAITFAQSGREYTANGPGEFVVTADELRADRGAAPARRDVAALRDGPGALRATRTATASSRMRSARGAAEAQTPPSILEYPVATKVATLQPVLRWHASDAMRDAKVTLIDESGKTVWAGGAANGVAKPTVKLSPATRYTWTVMTSRSVVGEASFETLAADPLARAESSADASRSFSGRVMHALLLQDLGAGQDAKALWSQLARERPDLPELANLAR